jgi:hypothetical protein
MVGQMLLLSSKNLITVLHHINITSKKRRPSQLSEIRGSQGYSEEYVRTCEEPPIRPLPYPPGHPKNRRAGIDSPSEVVIPARYPLELGPLACGEDNNGRGEPRCGLAS